jgi:hypothetical protein
MYIQQFEKYKCAWSKIGQLGSSRRATRSEIDCARLSIKQRAGKTRSSRCDFKDACTYDFCCTDSHKNVQVVTFKRYNFEKRKFCINLCTRDDHIERRLKLY